MSLRIHHLNAATLCPAAAKVPGLMPRRLVAHCLLLEGDDGLTLVDTGIGSADVADPSRLGRPFVAAVGARLDPDEPAVERVRMLGLDPSDVRDVVVTHLDLDHAGGLPDFPKARVHVRSAELAAARARRTPKDRGRYLPVQWEHRPDWVEHPDGGQDWFGFHAVPVVGDDVLLVPLTGHTLGHAGVAVRRPSGGWFLHAGDAYFFHGEKDTPPSCPPGLRAFQALVQTDRTARFAAQERLRELHATHAGEVTIFSAHDAIELDNLAGQTD